MQSCIKSKDIEAIGPEYAVYAINQEKEVKRLYYTIWQLQLFSWQILQGQSITQHVSI